MIVGNLRHRTHVWIVVLGAGVIAVAASAVWWYVHRVDGARVLVDANASYFAVAGYEAEIATGATGGPLRAVVKRRALMRTGLLAALADESIRPANGRVLRTFVNASFVTVTVDGHSCWTKTTSDRRQISRDFGIGQPPIPPTERMVDARRGGHGYLIETVPSVGAGRVVSTTWDIDAATHHVRSRTIQLQGHRVNKMIITRELSAPPTLVRPGVLCAI